MPSLKDSTVTSGGDGGSSFSDREASISESDPRGESVSATNSNQHAAEQFSAPIVKSEETMASGSSNDKAAAATQQESLQSDSVVVEIRSS